MILAAGFGTRLLPYTLVRPKPLFPILNQSLLLLTIQRLQQAGCDHIVVNCHYLREQIVCALHGIPGVVVQEETSVLGTGGGLRLALGQLRDEPVLVTNGDIYHTIDYQRLYQDHKRKGAPVTMAMHDFPRFNTVAVRDGRIYSFDDRADRAKGGLLAFTGLHVVEPAMLAGIPAEEEYSIIDWYRHLLQQGQPIAAIRVDDCFWTDMGTVEDYLALHAGLLTGKIPVWPELEWSAKRPFLVADQEKMGSGLVLRDWVCVGDAVIGKNAHLQRSVVWDEAMIAEGRRIVDQLVVQ
ncbi:MAG: sugar phosphate nucleotidyltransferase [Deltaproteobacteria bacterium]|nr:sugar phosphate nucleotidyltransferase [Deltaproteobacteria bacterium]